MLLANNIIDFGTKKNDEILAILSLFTNKQNNIRIQKVRFINLFLSMMIIRVEKCD